MTLTSGEEERGNDFANFRQAAKSGVKYNDLDADGTQDVGDAGAFRLDDRRLRRRGRLGHAFGR